MDLSKSDVALMRHRSGKFGWSGSSYLDGLQVELQALILVDEELLNILALVPLELDHLSHLRVVDDRSIAGYRGGVESDKARMTNNDSRWQDDSPNFFLITFRIFFWSNFLGNP